MTQALGMAPGITSTVRLRGIHRYRHSQRHDYAYSVASAIEQFVDLDAGGPQH